MISKILVLDSSSSDKSDIPDFITNLFELHSNYIEKFTSLDDLIVSLLTTEKYTLKYNEKTDKIESVLNIGEQDIFYPVGIIINSDETKGESDSDASKINLIIKRFYHLNPILLSLSFSDYSYNKNKSLINNELIPRLSLINDCISDRFLRIRTWIGLIETSNKDLEFPVYSMPALILIYQDDSNLKKCIQTNNEATETILKVDYKSLLTLNHDEEYYKSIVNTWAFPAHNLTIDELLLCGYHMLSPLFSSDLLPNDNLLLCYLFFIRDNYRIGNPFHNFRHAIDVLQACHFMVSSIKNNTNSPLKLSSNETLALYLASLGHDLGHPGITNLFLVNFHTPLAKTFDEKSVLENFHHLQFKHITDLYFDMKLIDINDTTISEKFEKISRSAILATDMANHDKYVEEISEIQNYTNRLDQILMLCSLLIKCADISNVCRPLFVSAKWGLSLGDEFKEVSSLESLLQKKMNDSEAINGLPDKEEEVELIKSINSAEEAVKIRPGLCDSQLFFINRFASDFFQKIANSINGLEFLAENLKNNEEFWKANQKRN